MVHNLNLNQEEETIEAAKTVIKVSTFLLKYLHYISLINFINILRTSFHKFCVLLLFKNYKNGTIRICKKT